MKKPILEIYLVTVNRDEEGERRRSQGEEASIAARYRSPSNLVCIIYRAESGQKEIQDRVTWAQLGQKGSTGVQIISSDMGLNCIKIASDLQSVLIYKWKLNNQVMNISVVFGPIHLSENWRRGRLLSRSVRDLGHYLSHVSLGEGEASSVPTSPVKAGRGWHARMSRLATGYNT
ncbi:hypothetical protein J6590_011661 [Homalodisca vitripennis]|nr:hypothetical protein J6590_011661 [Homalodisca vitripennis]